jgi:hypothetical protein
MALYLIWSNEHKAWWKPDHNGYTTNTGEAGRYQEREARFICERANIAEVNEVLCLAPEFNLDPVAAYQKAPVRSVPLDLFGFDPLPATHPMIGKACAACDHEFIAGDITTIVPLGPADNQEARQKSAAGHYYVGVGVCVHFVCATGKETK